VKVMAANNFLLFLLQALYPKGQLTVTKEQCNFIDSEQALYLSEPLTIARYICSKNKYFTLNFKSNEAKAQISQWLSLAGKVEPTELNSFLANRSFLVEDTLSLADLAVYFSTALFMGALSPDKMRTMMHFSRWFDQVQHSARDLADNKAAAHLPALIPVNIHTILLVPRAPKSKGPDKTAEKPLKQQGTAEKRKAEEHSPRDANIKKSPKKEPALEAATESGGKKPEPSNDQKPKANKEPGQKAPAPGDAAGVLFKPSVLDIRVGRIVKVWEHPEAQKLFCEEIDVGESEPRCIASGLRAFYNLHEMENQLVLVLANLKPRNLVGFKSHGMVLCASNADHTEVKFVRPPAGSKVGERVTFDGMENDSPATPNELAKKKMFEGLAPFLTTDADGKALFRRGDEELYFKVETQMCSSDLCNSRIS